MRENITPQMAKSLMNYNETLSDLKYAIANALDAANNNAFDYDEIIAAVGQIFLQEDNWKQAYANLKWSNYPLPDTIYELLFVKNEKFEEAV